MMDKYANIWKYAKGVDKAGGVLVIGDHAANMLPHEINLQIAPEHMNTHIAVDIGTAEVAHLLKEKFGFSIYLAAYSRLVVDLNRHRKDIAVIPDTSDGIDIPGNALTPEQRETRLQLYYDRYHEGLEAILADLQPDFLLFLHSYTPALGTDTATVRRWHFGVMYDQDERAARIALEYLATTGRDIGDQLPYSGRTYNSALIRHGEARSIPYIGLEVRNDMIDTARGQDEFADIIGAMCQKITQTLASEASPRD